MKQFNAAHLEIKKSFTEGFETHPYEVGWADEVIFFIFEGTLFEPITTCGLHFVKVTHFGNYIRLAVDIDNAEFKLQIQIASKG